MQNKIKTAQPYHFHEKMDCLFTADVNNHSTKIGTALDGNPIYGKYIEGGVIPTDLDACGGRVGTTGDLKDVYYYVVQDKPPFTMGCLAGTSGPVSVETCRSLYETCADDPTTVTTKAGSIQYVLDCPCFSNGTNVNENTQPGGDGGPPDGGGGGGESQINCPATGPYDGETEYKTGGPFAAPLRGTIGCVMNHTNENGEVANLIYGPL